MQDLHRRSIKYLRISLTDRCNFHCTYCRPNHSEKLCHTDILTYEEILKICEVAVALGIHQFKITGGDPFMRKGCLSFLERLKTMPGASWVSITTNGSLLEESDLRFLHKIGIDGINISLDTMNSYKFAEITGVPVLERVIQTIQSAYELGLSVKINAVVEDFIDWELLQWIKTRKLALRFIERMPIGAKAVASHMDLYQQLIDRNLTLLPVTQSLGCGPAVYYRIPGYVGYLGLIQPMHRKFCANCNRIRLTSIGELRPCLYGGETISLKAILRSDGNQSELQEAFRQAILMKPIAHHFEEEPAGQIMSSIGG